MDKTQTEAFLSQRHFAPGIGCRKVVLAVLRRGTSYKVRNENEENRFVFGSIKCGGVGKGKKRPPQKNDFEAVLSMFIN